MDEIYSRIKKLAQNDVVSKRVSRLPVGDCHCYEDSDQHAFSATHAASRLLQLQNDTKEQQHQQPSILQEFRDDENWNNPNGVMLMLRSYALQDEDQHWTLAHPVEQRLPLDELNYLKIKTEQYRAIAEKNIYDAARLLQESEIANAIQKLNEAIRYDDQNVNAFYLRAKAYIALMDWTQAHADIEAALKLTPDCEPLLDLLQEVQSKRLGSTAWRGDHTAASSSSSAAAVASSSSGAAVGVKKRKYAEANDTGSSSRLSLNTNPNKEYGSGHAEAYPMVHADTILRLQSSLQADESSSSSSSSASSDDDDDSSSSSGRSSKKKSKKRRRHSKHSKHKKAKKTHKHSKKEKKDKKSKSKDHKRS